MFPLYLEVVASSSSFRRNDVETTEAKSIHDGLRTPPAREKHELGKHTRTKVFARTRSSNCSGDLEPIQGQLGTLGNSFLRQESKRFGLNGATHREKSFLEIFADRVPARDTPRDLFIVSCM